MPMGSSRRVLAMVVFASVVQLAACSSDEPEPSSPPSGVERNKKLGSLTATERRTMCDWAAQLFGGYGMSHPCTPQLRWPGPASADACVAQLATAGASCMATVATYESCFRSFFDKASCRPDAGFPQPCATLSMCYSAR